ncbi:MAG: pyridoxal 5'-phosphate synthase glutaminase subunit PdxT [candidate division Zixibacteria bacterium]|nr:pyridoxal 5'-phosphate synthase glutaminase subunit PdxT [candidate division Zixibacteria bacterium]
MRVSEGNPVGILSLQGDFEKHRQALAEINSPSKEVRTVEDLTPCSALIIPGGESTTMRKLMAAEELDSAVKKFAESRPIMGTCAGMILLSSKVEDSTVEPLKLIDMTVRRNAYGRQIHSFIDTGRVPMWEDNSKLEMVFIRAPQVVSYGPAVIPLATLGEEVVMVRSGKILVLAFHPELAADRRVHRFFVEEFIEERKGIPVAL